MSITSISLTIEDGVKKAEEYAPARKASVTLTADVCETDNPEVKLEWVRRLADAKVYEIIHNKPAKPVPQVASVGKTTPVPPSSQEEETPADATPPSGKAALEAEAVKAAGGKGAKFPATSKVKKTKAESQAELKPKEDAPEEITDLDLANAITKKNSALGKPQVISALLVDFGGRPAPKSVRDVPQDRRAEFLEKLEALS